MMVMLMSHRWSSTTAILEGYSYDEMCSRRAKDDLTMRPVVPGRSGFLSLYHQHMHIVQPS